MKFFEFISQRFRQFFSPKEAGKPNETDPSLFVGREKAIAFTLSVFFAICLWFIVNMNRDFNVTVDVPIQVVNLPDNMAISSDLPEKISVNVSGEGWKLINLYNNPPRVNLSAESRQVNLFEQIRNQGGVFSEVNVMQVDPILLNIETEEKATKKVPVVSRIEINMRDQYGLITEPGFDPDSVTVTGALSKLEQLTYWETVDTEMNDINRSTERRVDLKPGSSGTMVEPSSVTVRVDVAEFTEAEVRIPIRTRNLPSGKAITYNPSFITIKYDVPIDQYSEVRGSRPFSAFVDYTTIELDTTGLITPEIEKSSDDLNVRMRSFQPHRVSYFNILSD